MTYTLTASTGEFALTGQAAALRIGHALLADTGEFALNPARASFGSFSDSSLPTRVIVRQSDGAVKTSNGPLVYMDNIEGHAYESALQGGETITRSAMVDGLSADDGVDTAAKCNAAINAVMEITGNFGSPCPNVPNTHWRPTYLTRFVPEITGPTACRVKIIYRSYMIPQYEIESSLNQIETNIDRAGDPISVEYTYPDDYTLDTRKAGLTIDQGGMVNQPIAETVITVSFTVARGYIPYAEAKEYFPGRVGGSGILLYGYMSAALIMTTLSGMEGKLNENSFQFGNCYGGPRCWLIERVRGTSRDGGQTYDASISMHLKEYGWDQLTVFINPDDGKPPPDLVEDVGYKRPEVIEEIHFPSWLFTNPYRFVPDGYDWTWQ